MTKIEEYFKFLFPLYSNREELDNKLLRIQSKKKNNKRFGKFWNPIIGNVVDTALIFEKRTKHESSSIVLYLKIPATLE